MLTGKRINSNSKRHSTQKTIPGLCPKTWNQRSSFNNLDILHVFWCVGSVEACVSIELKIQSHTMKDRWNWENRLFSLLPPFLIKYMMGRKKPKPIYICDIITLLGLKRPTPKWLFQRYCLVQSFFTWSESPGWLASDMTRYGNFANDLYHLDGSSSCKEDGRLKNSL